MEVIQYTSTTIPILHTFSELPPRDQSRFAKDIANYSRQQDSGVDSVSIATVLNRYNSIVALSDKDTSFASLVGYIANDEPVFHNGRPMVEVGTLYVPEIHRHQGIGRLLIESITHKVNRVGHQPYAVCNDNSVSLFEFAGYIPTTDTSEFPLYAFWLAEGYGDIPTIAVEHTLMLKPRVPDTIICH